DRLFRIKLGALSADLVEDVDKVRLDVEQAKFEYREQADRARADDEDVGFNGLTHLSTLSELSEPFDRHGRDMSPQSSWPGLSRPSTSSWRTRRKSWVPATSAGMTDKTAYLSHPLLIQFRGNTVGPAGDPRIRNFDQVQ